MSSYKKPIESYLKSINKPSKFSGEIKEIIKFDQGQSNPTFLIEDTFKNLMVLRKKPEGKLISKLAHDIKREYKIMSFLLGKLAVPKMLAYCEDELIIGTPFYVIASIIVTL